MISILIVETTHCSLMGLLYYQSAVVLLDPASFCNFNSIIPVEVVRVKCYVNEIHKVNTPP